ncbi:MAG: Protein of unknown function (DUF1553)/Protein of unknown function (DUF1549)/Planctomycete, partial [Verrucomicrobiales bacterium]|nr:Protein of unknown function (DUF1553)/Protein of unknown function (DUF1549)/Planctomycete [Verrucomicrobiales bacterium]
MLRSVPNKSGTVVQKAICPMINLKGWLTTWALFFVTAARLVQINADEVDLAKIPPPVSRTVHFVEDIHPIFSRNCYKCHGAEKQKNGLRLDVKSIALRGGSSGPVIIPRNGADSLLIQYVSALPEEKAMPQKGPRLTTEEISILRAWIDQGAEWPDGLDPKDFKGEQEHWAFTPLLRPPVPEVVKKEWVRNVIDRFVLARLEKEKLTPSPDADKVTLIRRLYSTLIGLPPTPEEVKSFLAQDSPQAYEELVERLLNSPRYGERWARHWLDIVRFAESNGFETNTERPNAWPYRDYVIKAFNDDMPYPEFIAEQLAGDALKADAATGFLVAGANDAVKSPDINLTAQQRMDELHDMVATTGSAFLGLTVGCARCHNHKFDPISQVDYYSMQAIFAGVQHGERQLHGPGDEEGMQKAESERREVARLDDQLFAFIPTADPSPSVRATRAPVARLNEEKFAPVQARSVRFSINATADGSEPCLDELEIYTSGEHPQNIALAASGAKAKASGTYPNSDLHKLEHINDGKTGNSHSWISNERGKGWVQIDLPQPALIDRVIWGRDREEVYRDRLALVYAIEVSEGSNVWKTVAERTPMRPPVHPRLNVDRFAPVDARFLRFTVSQTTGAEPCIDELEIYTAEDASRNIALAASGTRVTASGSYAGNENHKLEHINDGKVGNSRSWISDEPGRGWVQFEFPEKVTIN